MILLLIHTNREFADLILLLCWHMMSPKSTFIMTRPLPLMSFGYLITATLSGAEIQHGRKPGRVFAPQSFLLFPHRCEARPGFVAVPSAPDRSAPELVANSPRRRQPMPS